MISGLNNTDLSLYRTGDVIRQLKQLREDVKESGFEIVESVDRLKQPKGNPNSPYAPERAGEQKILGMDIEKDWRRRLNLIY
jgi:hypothetical protein